MRTSRQLLERSIRSHFRVNYQSTSPRLDALRQQLQEEAKDEGVKVRGSKKNLPKPSWLKAEVPRGENYEHLRNTGEILIEFVRNQLQ